ncbi:MAG: bifunctional acetate--CoA ligase family protein/GNAT family N-acetyltransferase [Acidobacteria bacterium]|nr:bifunctional acetate--CoA ligase family protein/GNAT family N-acetyltransferase [Acidobacteriota bacterium]
MPISPLIRLFKPKSVALFGASSRPNSTGGVLLRNLLEGGFEGPIYPINPKHGEVQGRKAYPSLADVPEHVELAVIATPAPTIPAILESCGELGVEAAVIISAGFGEAGPQGKALEKRVVEIAHRNRIRFLGPNCLGFIRPDIGLNATFSAESAAPGRLALVSQSGALCTSILDWARVNKIGFSNVISTGIGADLDFGEILEFLVADRATDAIMLYIEGVRDARRFLSGLRAASRVKPVIVIKGGRQSLGSGAAVSHTGALIGSDAVFDAAIRRAGAVRVHTLTAFFATATTLNAGVRGRGRRVAILTNGGGPAVIAADRLADRHLDLAQLSPETMAKLNAILPAPWSHGNPVDVLGDADPGRYASSLEICLADPQIDAVLAVLTPQAMTEPVAVAEQVAAIAKKSHKPVLVVWMGGAQIEPARQVFREAVVPNYRTPDTAVECIASIVAHRENQQLLLQAPPPLSNTKAPDVDGAKAIIEHALSSNRTLLTTAESKAVLAAFHIPILPSVRAHDRAEALVVAEELGFPVALKISSPDITHKSDVGGVKLGLRTASELLSAYDDMMAAVQRVAPEARVDGVFVEPMWTRGSARELMVGVTTDPVFGPSISFGLGGVMVEAIGGHATALPPLNQRLIQDLLERARGARVLQAFRGRPPVNHEALESVLLRVSEMVCELPYIAEMDINPLLADERGVSAVDARIIVKRVPPATKPYAHMAIHPYPSSLERIATLEGGERVTIRPIRPEDATIGREFVERLSEESKYMRFMQALHEITPEMLSRLTQIDYDRELALIAVVEREGRESEIGVARYATLADGETCEFAVVIDDSWRGKGLASMLFKDLVEAARKQRLVRMEGTVLAQNRRMLEFSKNAGFKIEPDPDDRTLVKITLDL